MYGSSTFLVRKKEFDNYVDSSTLSVLPFLELRSPMTSRCFLFTGGGTGGHVSPALAIAEGIRSRHPDAHFVYVGVHGKAEARMVPKHWATELDEGLASIRFVRSKGYTGMNLSLLSFMFNVSLGVFSSFFILLSARPAAIIATGGYVSAPILFAAYLLKNKDHSLKNCRFMGKMLSLVE